MSLQSFYDVIALFPLASLLALGRHPCWEEDPFMRMWLSRQDSVVLCLWILFPWHSCPPHTTPRKSAATLGNKASLAGRLLQLLKLSVVIVIFRHPLPPLPPGKRGETAARTRDCSQAGSDAGWGDREPLSSDCSLLFPLLRCGKG